ncbi:sensor histidine kinase [Geomesophilobacter sediminis]|uniref:histidine kinase n=1 Tax=Geomesophilobacter sediminis TaxID=2798584 RepID=A0A8J7SA12_9BACT|nr:PAS domain S-box protein [Geomesophilobacter sediminis]MBJ6727210.1 PAS domain S-box protein [Geomesophilobacter sediminis]
MIGKKYRVQRPSYPGTAAVGQTTGDDQFRQMVDQIKEYAVFMLDQKGYVLTWNAGAERIKGYQPQEVIGRHFSIFYPPEDVAAELPQRELQIVATQGSYDTQGWRLRKDGSRFWAAVTITALHDNQGNLTGFAKITRDITERHELEEALKRSRALFERLFETGPDAIVVIDQSGVIRRVNQQAEVIFGYQREELIGRRVERLMPERFQARHRQHRRNYFAEPKARRMGIGLELYGRNKDGREIPVDIMLTPIETSDGPGAFAVIRDISRQKQSDEKILELNNALQIQVAQLGASNRELEAFSYSVSHDLRAPLRHIIGFVDLLNTRNAASLDEKSRHYLQVITDAAQKMGSLIDDLLAFSRMGRAEVMRRSIPVGALVSDVVGELMEDAGAGREIEWKIAPLPDVVGDQAMLRQVFVNLIGNALKFTRRRQQAQISIGAVDQGNDIAFFVGDNGVGFDPAYVNKLFGLFQRLHATEEFEGTGVGLALVQRIIQRHGGRVWAEGSVGEGATFWFSLPKTGETN